MTCADGIFGRVVVDVGGEVGMAEGVGVVGRGYEGECAQYDVEVWCVEEVSVWGERVEGMSDEVGE